jgi:hypothetical protein
MTKRILTIKGKSFLVAGEELTPLADDTVYEVQEKKNEDKRTLLQNRALHKYFSLVADALNNGGYDMKTVLKVNVQWTPITIKEVIWKSVQNALLNKRSTTNLLKKDVDLVYDNVNKILSDKYQISVPFPSEESNR